ncbi:ABC transporter permease [Lactococcus termiticola]|uniref:ABC transporter permease protein n=1 Tax=Lactococcus termiticola TaxID=2169526 RepID=A0A2R5HHY4_9LACT|nr:ABC transporter permease [Lactococcus termiticola]GBG97025.1 ABC transporter permease protein [Lactococcus termiticola]
MKKFMTYLMTELKLRFRIPVSVFFIFIFPIFLMIAFASSFGHADPHYVQDNMAIIMFYGVLSASVTSFSSDLARYKQDNFYFLIERRSGNKLLYLLAQIIAFLIIIFVSTLAVLLVAHLNYHYQLPGLERLLPFYLKLFAYTLPWFLVSLIIGFSAKNSAVASAIAMPVMFVSYFLSGMMVPYSLLTGGLQKIAQHFFLTQNLSDLTASLGQTALVANQWPLIIGCYIVLIGLAAASLYRNVLVRN